MKKQKAMNLYWQGMYFRYGSLCESFLAEEKIGSTLRFYRRTVSGLTSVFAEKLWFSHALG